MANILYGVSGEGSGHSSRSKEIISYLQKKHKVHVITYGKAYDYLSKYVNATKIYGLHLSYKDNRVEYVETVKNNIIKKLEKLGYDYNLEHQRDKRRIFLQKKITYSGKERRIHIHLTLNNEFWNTFIAFRNYLRTHDKERDEYAKLKKEAVKHAKGEGTKYREYKSKFLENITKRALRTYSVGL